jgi:hypothetical protein
VREVRTALQHRPILQADRLDLGQDLPPGAAEPASGHRADAAGRRARAGGHGRTISKLETGKDSAQVLAESAAVHVGRIATIVTAAVREIAHEIGEWASDAFEMRDAAARAEADRPPVG